MKQWRLLGSTTDAPQRPTFLSTVSKDDFETCITYTRGGYDYFQVVALDSRGETLAFSEFKNLDGDSVGEADIQTTMTGPLDDELSGLVVLPLNWLRSMILQAFKTFRFVL